jgi:hypothetical protein
MQKLTKAQAQAIARAYARLEAPQESFLAFRRKARPMFGGGGAIVLPWAGMWLAIETDGHCHS